MVDRRSHAFRSPPLRSRLLIGAFATFALLFFAACDGGGTEPPPEENGDDPEPERITLDPSVTHQTLLGFGGALTWHADRITRSPQRDEIVQLLFDDLGTDFLRLKNWYYPAGYPEDTSPDAMEVDWFKPHFDATNELYELAKQHNPDIDVLLSSWGPPSALKSNDALSEGTLKRDDESGGFMYEAFADYWVDVLEHITFTPEYVSIQNEPSFVTPDWETSAWRPNETEQYPGYEAALDAVYARLQEREQPPTLIGPESANLGTSDFGNTFGAFAETLRDKDYLGLYAYHTYNFDANTSIDETTPHLQMLKEDFADKPNLMTEYSGMSWLQTARFINHTLVEANASGYIYWEMMWALPSDPDGSSNAMLTVDESGNYARTPFYYVIKHFARHVDEGHRRIDVAVENTVLTVSGYVQPEEDRLTLIVVNPFGSAQDVELAVAGRSMQDVRAWQSTEDAFYRTVENLSPGEPLSVPGRSITTVVIDV